MLPVRRQIDRVRRLVEQRLDQAWALSTHRLRLKGHDAVPHGHTGFAVVTVNFSTTRYLKLMLLTLADQLSCDRLLKRIVIADNGSRDGGKPFLRELARQINRVTLVENRGFLNHARGMRSGLRHLARIEEGVSPNLRSGIVLSCDSDIAFLRPDTLQALASLFESQDVALAGEFRHDVYCSPEAQASFLAVRRDCYGRRDIAPWVNHGAPAYWLQRSILKAGLGAADFPGYRDGYVLHRGRTGVDAAGVYMPLSSYASVADRLPNFMDVPGGADTWRGLEQRWAALLDGDERNLIDHFTDRFG